MRRLSRVHMLFAVGICAIHSTASASSFLIANSEAKLGFGIYSAVKLTSVMLLISLTDLLQAAKDPLPVQASVELKALCQFVDCGRLCRNSQTIGEATCGLPQRSTGYLAAAESSQPQAACCRCASAPVHFCQQKHRCLQVKPPTRGCS